MGVKIFGRETEKWIFVLSCGEKEMSNFAEDFYLISIFSWIKKKLIWFIQSKLVAITDDEFDWIYHKRAKQNDEKGMWNGRVPEFVLWRYKTYR